VLWVGSLGGMEQVLVSRAGIAYHGIDTGKLRGAGPLTALANAGKMVRGVRQSLDILRHFEPDVCLVTGGYVCAPVVVACRLRRVPVLIYLPDMTPGWSIRAMSLLAQRVAVSFPDAARYFGGEAPRGKAVVTGYPVRRELVAAAQDRCRARRDLAQSIDRPQLSGEDGVPLILVWGGSQGARSINLAAWRAVPDLVPHAHILHVVGERDWDMAKERIRDLRAGGALPGRLVERYHPVDYLHEAMPLALAAADLTIARAGASILGEFTVTRLPAILAPLPFAGVNQARNADQLACHGAAVVVDDAKLIADLTSQVLTLLSERDRLAKMGEAAGRLAQPDAAQRIADELRKLAWERHV
jgi:UDP-N-acetylglucosamine--N-acetylmuramyl-(pentapeptide) pyrophosphoryl-undecaprenol N-acetylglucosamine transferase